MTTTEPNEEPLRPLSKIGRWGLKSGYKDPHRGLMIKAYQKGTGKGKNSDPVGRKRRWSPGRAMRMRLGKHGLVRMLKVKNKKG